ncbi:hypothetical protein H5410_060199, partial [Solanum commersonii]
SAALLSLLSFLSPAKWYSNRRRRPARTTSSRCCSIALHLLFFAARTKAANKQQQLVTPEQPAAPVGDNSSQLRATTATATTGGSSCRQTIAVAAPTLAPSETSHSGEGLSTSSSARDLAKYFIADKHTLLKWFEQKFKIWRVAMSGKQ